MKIINENENAMLDYVGWREARLFTVGVVRPDWNEVRAERDAQRIREALEGHGGIIDVQARWPYTVVTVTDTAGAEAARAALTERGEVCGKVRRVKVSLDGHEYKLLR